MARLVLGHPYLPVVLWLLAHLWYLEDRFLQAGQQALVEPGTVSEGAVEWDDCDGAN